MIKANELRLTNLVLFNDMILSFNRINEHKLYLKQEETGKLFECSLSQIKPIPLTEEILLKCGFENDSEFRSFTKYIEHKHFEFRNDGRVILFDDFEGIFLHECFYLHQLQNLYFALTGEELKIEI